MRLSRLSLVLSLLAVPALGQQPDPGFHAELGAVDADHLAGRWINEFLFASDGGQPQRFWQIVEFGDSTITHDYFSSDPRLQLERPYTRVVSAWSVGLFIDPDLARAPVSVIRLQPAELIRYDDRRDRTNRTTGNFAPQFRSFSCSADGAQLALSELVVLELPADGLLSFPEDTIAMLFERLDPLATSVQGVSWASVKGQFCSCAAAAW